MVNVSVIKSKRDNQTLEDVEVIDNINDASNEYIYFKNTNAMPDFESLETESDISVFNPKKGYGDSSEKFLQSFDGFITDIFKTDFDFAFSLIRKLNWDILVRKDKLTDLYNSEIRQLPDAIETYNHIFRKFTDNDMMGEYKEYLYDVKVEQLLKIYEKNPTEDAYDMLKEDFTQMIYHWRFTEFSVNTTVLNKLFFDNVVYTKTYDDFYKLMEDYYIRVDIFYLNEDIREIQKQNKKIKQDTEKLSKINRDIINSRSWKLTKPLRAIK